MISLLHSEKILNGRLTWIVLTVVLLTVTFGPFSRFSSKITYTSGRGYPRTYKTKYRLHHQEEVIRRFMLYMEITEMKV